jgi:hypoxanthine phosphoribosyltransferase
MNIDRVEDTMVHDVKHGVTEKGGDALNAPELLALTGGKAIDEIVYTSAEIAARVRAMGEAISDAYPADDKLLLLALLKGSFIFVADLVRCVSRPVQIDFVVASSYGKGTTSSGIVELLYDPATPMQGRHVILVEDIVDSGTTLNRLVGALSERGVASLEICALLHKHVASELQLEPRWVGFDAPDSFLVGYGLDHAEDFRHLPFIASLA